MNRVLKCFFRTELKRTTTLNIIRKCSIKITDVRKTSKGRTNGSSFHYDSADDPAAIPFHIK